MFVAVSRASRSYMNKIDNNKKSEKVLTHKESSDCDHELGTQQYGDQLMWEQHKIDLDLRSHPVRDSLNAVY